MPKQDERAAVSPLGGRRGCLCKDNTYKSECCNGELWQQGVGSLENQTTSQSQNVNQPRTKSNSYS
jgi:hypothetical protein